MIGVSQSTRLLHFISVITFKGAIERKDKRTGNSRCFTNPYNVNGDGAEFIFITSKGVIKFGSNVTTAALMEDSRVTALIEKGDAEIAAARAAAA